MPLPLPHPQVKDAYILGGIEDVQVALEDSMVTMSTILASRFVGGIRGEVEKVEKQLNLFADSLDEWVGVQKTWMYLEPIFSAPDIQRQVRDERMEPCTIRLIRIAPSSTCRACPDVQLPVEAKQFFATDKQFKDVMRKTKDRPNALLVRLPAGLPSVSPSGLPPLSPSGLPPLSPSGLPLSLHESGTALPSRRRPLPPGPPRQAGPGAGRLGAGGV